MIFTGVFKTTDDKLWSVGFEALSWEDAESLAELMGIGHLGMSLGTTDIEPDLSLGLPSNLEPSVQHFAAWHYREGRFVNEEA